MERYLKFSKPTKTKFDHNLNVYNSYMKLYEDYKKKNGTTIINEGQDNEFIFVNEESTDSFHITSISRADFLSRGWDASELTDNDMRRIAEKMSNVYVGDGGFWESVDFWAEEYDCARINN